MKQTMKITSVLLIAALLMICFASCSSGIDTEALWENAAYSADTTLGGGANTVYLELTAGEKTVKFTIKTDKATLGEALFELDLVNDPLFFDTCNGIIADWSKDKAYWGFYVGDSRTGADFGIGNEKAITSGGPTYRIVYEK